MSCEHIDSLIDAVKPGSDAEYSDAAMCESSEKNAPHNKLMPVCTVTASGSLPSSHVSPCCNTAAEEAVEAVHDKHSPTSDSGPDEIVSTDTKPVCSDQSPSMHLTVDTHIEHISASGQKPEDSSERVQKQPGRSLLAVEAGKERSYYDNGLAQKCTSQSSIRSFFKPVMPKMQQNGTAACSSIHSTQNNREQASSNSPEVSCDRTQHCHRLLTRPLAGNPCINASATTSYSLQTNANKAVATGTSSFSDKTRKCPFYKWIPGNVLQFLL